MLLLGCLLGSIGQGARFLVGMVPREPRFQKTPALTGLVISLFVGAVAGGIGSITFLGKTIGGRDMVALLVIGYAGTDAIEQLVKAKLPGARAV
jgi:hypothetical protein